MLKDAMTKPVSNRIDPYSTTRFLRRSAKLRHKAVRRRETGKRTSSRKTAIAISRIGKGAISRFCHANVSRMTKPTKTGKLRSVVRIVTPYNLFNGSGKKVSRSSETCQVKSWPVNAARITQLSHRRLRPSPTCSIPGCALSSRRLEASHHEPARTNRPPPKRASHSNWACILRHRCLIRSFSRLTMFEAYGVPGGLPGHGGLL